MNINPKFIILKNKNLCVENVEVGNFNKFKCRHLNILENYLDVIICGLMSLASESVNHLFGFQVTVIV